MLFDNTTKYMCTVLVAGRVAWREGDCLDSAVHVTPLAVLCTSGSK